MRSKISPLSHPLRLSALIHVILCVQCRPADRRIEQAVRGAQAPDGGRALQSRRLRVTRALRSSTVRTHEFSPSRETPAICAYVGPWGHVFGTGRRGIKLERWPGEMRVAVDHLANTLSTKITQKVVRTLCVDRRRGRCRCCSTTRQAKCVLTLLLLLVVPATIR